MKTIEITDEEYNFLINLKNELTTQPNRGTRSPYFFQIQTKEQIAVPEGCGTEAWHYDGSLLEEEEEINEVISEDKGIPLSEVQKMNSWEKEEILEEMGYNKINYDYRFNYENCFLTEKACKEHIEMNKHNYKKPVSYLSHAYRNIEMESLIKILTNLK